MPDRARDDQIEAMFHEALERPRAERARFVRERCPDDPAAQAEVLALLATLDRPTTGVLAGPPLTLVDDAMTQAGLDARDARAASEPLPQRIGPFRVVRLLGEGGMGRVYEAEQDNPRRMVAIKVVRPGVVSREVLRRFAHEAQILASLKHPGIAQVFQAGAIARPGGAEQPYFAMEVVRGPNLVEFALRRRLGPGEKAELLARVCDAVQHAHQKGVVHRDLKPANILVEEHDQDDSRAGASVATTAGGLPFSPKILDFGIARLTDGADEALSTLRTAAGQIIGTLAYMAPEQLDADPAARPDTRCDIYALGALGYELLAGRLPIDLSGRPLAEAARLIREVEPPTLGAVKPELRGDLETIIAKAMDKEPSRRYASAGELAADLRRHLRDEPILARPSSALYQLGKFARRNRTLVGGIAATVLALVAGAVVSGVLAFREASQRAQAQAVAARASIAAAAAELRTGGGASARSRLRSILPERRGWEWRYLARVADRSTGFLQLTGGWNPCPVVRADGGWDVLLSDFHADGPCRTWRPDAGADAAPDGATFPAHSYGIQVDPTGRTVMLHPDGETQLLVDRADGRELWRVGKVGSGPTAFSADGSLVVGYALGSSSITLRDSRTGREVASLPFRTVKSANVRFAPDDSILIQDEGATLRLDRSDGAVIESFPLVDAAFPRDMRFVVGAVRSDLVAYDRAKRERLYSIPEAGRWSWSISADGSVLAIGDPSGTLRTYDAGVGEPFDLLHAHDAAIKALWIAPDDKTIVSFDDAGGLRTFDLESAAAAIASAPRERASSPMFSPDGAMIASLGWGAVMFCDARTGVELGTISVRAPDRPGRSAFTARGDRLAVLGWGRTAWVFRTPAQDGSPGPLWTAEFDQDSRCAAWFDSDRRILVGLADGSLHTLDSDSGALLASEVVSDSPLWQIIADAGLVIVIDERGVIRWRREPSEPWMQHQGPPSPTSLAFAASAGLAAIGAADGQIVLFSLAQRRIVAQAKAVGPIYGLDFLPDASRLAVASNDSVVRVLETQTLTEALTVPTPAGRALAVSIDDHAFRIAGDAYSVISYDAEPTRELARARRLASQARRVIDPLFERLVYSKAVIEHLAGRTDLQPDLRQAAIAAARGRGDLLNSLNSQAWALVHNPGRSASACELALRHAEACCEALPEAADYQNTRAVALLRLERFPEALAAFELSDRLMRARRPAGHPTDAAGMSLCLSKLGRPEEAQQQLQRAEAMMRSDAQLAGDADNRQQIEEARAALLNEHAGPEAPSR